MSARKQRIQRKGRLPKTRSNAAGIPERSYRFVWQAAAVFCAAVALRLVYIAQIRPSPFFDVLLGDARRYDSWALQIAGGDWLGAEVFYQAPLYPYFLGVIYALFGHSVLAVRVCQALIGAAACTLIALTARRLFSERAGLIAGLGMAVYAPAIFFDGLLQKSALDLFFVSLCVWFISGMVTQSERSWRSLCLGITIGALALTRENGLIFAIPILLWLATGSQLGQRDRVRSVGLFIIGMTCVLLPVAARNAVVGGEWHLTTAQFGPNLYIGNNPNADGTYAALREGRGSPEYEREDAIELAEAASGRRLTPGEVSDFWTRRAVEFALSDPAAWVKLMWRKLTLLWNRTETLDTESQQSYEEWSPLLHALAWVGHFGVLVPLAVLGVFATWRLRRTIGIYYVMAMMYAASVLLFYVSARYRLPLVPFLILFAAAGLVSLREFVRASNARTMATASLIVAAVGIFTNYPLLSADLMRATTENNLGTALQTNQRLEEAERHYRRAIAIQPDYAPPYVNLGALLMAQNRAQEAVGAYQQATELNFAGIDLDYQLGNAFLKAGKPEAAVDHFRRAIDAGRESADLYNNLGVALTYMNREREAIVAYRKSLQLRPDNAGLHFTVGTLLLQQGTFEEAVDEFRAGLQLMPDSAEAHNNLGNALASSGRTAEAIAEFEHALRLNPNLVSARRNLEIAKKTLRR